MLFKQSFFNIFLSRDYSDSLLEQKADDLAISWGFKINESRDEEKKVKNRSPELFID